METLARPPAGVAGQEGGARGRGRGRRGRGEGAASGPPPPNQYQPWDDGSTAPAPAAVTVRPKLVKQERGMVGTEQQDIRFRGKQEEQGQATEEPQEATKPAAAIFGVPLQVSLH